MVCLFSVIFSWTCLKSIVYLLQANSPTYAILSSQIIPSGIYSNPTNVTNIKDAATCSSSCPYIIIIHAFMYRRNGITLNPF